MSSQSGQSSKPSRTIVKPILRKLTQSETNSIDLDRPTEDQDALGIYGYGNGNRSSHDVTFNQPGRRGYHTRSTSGTSQFSIATTGSGARIGSFIHPFQQTPRPFTPPLATASYQTSLRESEHSNSLAFTEDEDQLRHNFRSNSNLSNRTQSFTGNTSPIVGSQPLRIQTKLSSSRLALATSHTNLSNSTILSPDITSPTEIMSPASAIRTSFDKGFRIRSRSEVDTRGRSESIQEARRKFAEREEAKDEKAAQEEIRAMEKRSQKEARQIERGHRRSSASDGTRNKRSKSDLAMHEKDGLVGRAYGSVPFAGPVADEEEFEQPRRSQTGFASTKLKTHGTWTKFLMWFRTRLIRIGGKKKRSKERK
ncbi:hypothetical protein D0Z07_1982 [Hyphodiscus hymeniophilus]|uniref:Uncharacterized protein n=1 Tax=Hyphodiscus hymeniophilus TaxID=353542 RepID=A0A9P6VP94_9HELO|nr:hypothetical protein D0Z07_1982 [Hyphodiscus hymeniophilus]